MFYNLRCINEGIFALSSIFAVVLITAGAAATASIQPSGVIQVMSLTFMNVCCHSCSRC